MSSQMFEQALKETLNNEVSITENGAVGFKTTGQKLLDLNFKVSSFRNVSDAEIATEFEKAYYENPEYATKWLFFLRDREQGMGERRSFRVMFKSLVSIKPDIAAKLIKFIPEYGRWDDLIFIMDNSSQNEIIYNEILNLIRTQLKDDLTALKQGKSNISLLGKWLPSENTSSFKTKALARMIRNSLNMDSRTYRKTLSKLRKALDVVEVKISAKQWDKVNYNNVPSKANLKYNSSFLRNDNVRRSQYLSDLKNGVAGVKINSSVNFPCDIVNQYKHKSGFGWFNVHLTTYDVALEQMWKALPDFVSNENSDDTIVVADGSGSMTAKVGNTNMTALDVAQSLAIYFSEKLKGAFANKYITFSERPAYVDMTNCKTLFDKIKLANDYNEVANTNIKAVFDLLLTTAKQRKCSQDELPKNILIVSDMEFDQGTTFDGCERIYFPSNNNKYDAKKLALFEQIKTEFEEAGYQMPRLIFWNVCSRTETIPLKSNTLGVSLVSGFSPAVAKMVFSTQLDPWKCLQETLDSPRYVKINEALKN